MKKRALSKKCWCGYTDSFADAEDSVLKNRNDIHETVYQWAVIEEYYMSAYALPTDFIQWYHWSDEANAYSRCDTPKWAKYIIRWV